VGTRHGKKPVAALGGHGTGTKRRDEQPVLPPAGVNCGVGRHLEPRSRDRELARRGTSTTPILASRSRPRVTGRRLLLWGNGQIHRNILPIHGDAPTRPRPLGGRAYVLDSRPASPPGRPRSTPAESVPYGEPSLASALSRSSRPLFRPSGRGPGFHPFSLFGHRTEETIWRLRIPRHHGRPPSGDGVWDFGTSSAPHSNSDVLGRRFRCRRAGTRETRDAPVSLKAFRSGLRGWERGYGSDGDTQTPVPILSRVGRMASGCGGSYSNSQGRYLAGTTGARRSAPPILVIE